MRHFVIIFLLIWNIAGYGQVHEGLEIREYPWSMNAFNYPRTQGGDSVVVAKYNEVWYFNLDSLCYHIVADRRSVYTEDLVHYYYWEIMDYASEKQIEEGYRKIKAAAKKYNSDVLDNEADYMKIHGRFYSKLFSGGGATEEEMESAVQEMHKYIDRFIFINDKGRYLEYLAESYNMYRDFGNYAKMFKYIPPILNLLEQIKPHEYLNYYHLYYHIGSDYYNFCDYRRAVFFLRKALHDTPTHFADRSDLRARLVLAQYYAEINQLDSSDYYYRSIYDDRNTVRFRPYYDISAAAGIAKNLIRRGMHREAMPILKCWLPEAIRGCMKNDMFDVYIALCECYLVEKQHQQAKEMLDSIDVMMRKYPKFYFRKEKLFEQIFRYHLSAGHTDLAYQYIDSVQLARDIYEKRTNSLIILRAEQEVHEAEIAMKNEQEQKLKTLLQMAFAIIVLILLALLVISYFYRQKQKAWSDLVHKNLQWANQNALEVVVPVEDTGNGNGNGNGNATPADEDYNIVEQVHALMLNNEFKDCKLTLDTLAKKLNINRNSLSHAINTVTGKNFNNFVNEYRIKEALRIISKNRNLYIDELYGLVGFRSRTSFYRSFKQDTGLSPREFIDKLKIK